MTSEGVGPCVTVVGNIAAAMFGASYIDRVLVLALRSRQVMVVDNLGAYNGARVREPIEGRGYELLYLPPYSLNLNPVEKPFSNVKALLSKAGVRTRQALIEAMGRALGTVTTKDTRGFFEHCGYLLPTQPL